MSSQEYNQAILHPISEEFEKEPFEHRDSKPRLGYYKSLIAGQTPDLETIIQYYLDWVSCDEYLIFRKEDIRTLDKNYKAVKAAKRGNDVYSYKINKRLQHLDNLPNIEFFNYKDRNKRHKTRAVFATFTYRRDLSLDRQWENVGSDYNRSITGLKRRYGKIDVLRCWEAQKDGYPHIHCIILFYENEFETFFYNGKWRLTEKDELCRNWHWGFSDVFALYSLGAGVGYVKKYVTKIHNVLRDEKPKRGLVLSLALMWIFKKRAFSVTKGFGLFLVEEKDDCPHGQVDIVEGESIYRWYLVGFMVNDGRFTKWSADLSYLEFWDIRGSDYFSFNQALFSG